MLLNYYIGDTIGLESRERLTQPCPYLPDLLDLCLIHFILIRCGEMNQWIKCLVFKHENMKLDSSESM